MTDITPFESARMAYKVEVARWELGNVRYSDAGTRKIAIIRVSEKGDLIVIEDREYKGAVARFNELSSIAAHAAFLRAFAEAHSTNQMFEAVSEAFPNECLEICHGNISQYNWEKLKNIFPAYILAGLPKEAS